MVEYKIKPRLFGNPDRLQDPTKPLNIEVKTITAGTLIDLKAKVHEWLMDNQIGAGNWGDTPVYKNLKILGYMSYNGRVWDRTIWDANAKEIKD